MRKTIIERLIAKMSFPVSGCWIWTASLDGKGYGQINIDGQMHRAHRAAYRAFRGEIPDGLVLDHLCKTPMCVNPWHLEAVTQKENIRRGMSGQATIERAKKITHCPRGHEYNYENTHIRPLTGARSCRECRKQRLRRMREEKFAQGLTYKNVGGKRYWA